MKKNKKVILISGIASILTATVILVSGGSNLIVALLGGAGICSIPGVIHLNGMEKNKSNTSHVWQTNHVQITPEVVNNSEEINLQNAQVCVLSSQSTNLESRKSIAPIKQYEDETIILELITTDALSQQEDVLVRRRKKETEENLKPRNNDYKNNKK